MLRSVLINFSTTIKGRRRNKVKISLKSRAGDWSSSALLVFWNHYEILADPIGKWHLVGDCFHRSSSHQFTQVWLPSDRLEAHLAHAGNGGHLAGMDRQCRHIMEIGPFKAGKTNVLQLVDGVCFFRNQLLGLLGKNHSIPLAERPAVKFSTNAQLIQFIQYVRRRAERLRTIF